MQKVLIKAAKVKILAGVTLGLDTRWATAHAQFITRTKPGHFKVDTAISFPRGAVFYVDNPEKVLGKDDKGEVYEIVDMPYGYLGESDADKAKREALLKPKADPKAKPAKAA